MISRKPKVTEAEIRASLSGPAYHSNKIYVTAWPDGIRLAFHETIAGDKSTPPFRTAVYLSTTNAQALLELLDKLLP